MNPEEEEDDYEPAFVDASAADVTVHLDLNETDEPPPPDDDDDLDEEEEEDLEEEDGVMMEEDVAVEDRDAADESVLRPEKDECEMKMEERKGSIFAVAWATTTLENTGKDSVSAVKFSRHSNGSNNSEVLLATASLDGTVSVHDADGRYLRQLEGPETGVEWLEWHPNGPIVLAGCEDFCAWMWNASDGNLMQVFAGHSGSVSCGQFSKDGKVVFTGSFDGSFRAWNPRSGMAIAAFQKGGLFHDGPVTCMDSKVDDNGNYLVLTGSEDCTLKLSTVHANAADVGAGGSKVLGNFFAHEKCIECVEFCDGTVGNYAASGSVDATIRVWDLPTQKVRGVLGHGKAVSQLKWVPNSAMLYRCARFRFSKVVCALSSFFSSSSKILSRFFLFATKGPGATS